MPDSAASFRKEASECDSASAPNARTGNVKANAARADFLVSIRDSFEVVIQPSALAFSVPWAVLKNLLVAEARPALAAPGVPTPEAMGLFLKSSAGRRGLGQD